MPGYLKQSTAAQSRAIGPFVDATDYQTAETGLTIANTDIKLVVNGGASANKNSGGGTHRVNGVYGITFDATDTATVGEIELSVVVAGALPVFDKFFVLEEAVYDALFGASAPGYLQPTTAGRTLDVSATGEAGIDWANIGSPTTANNLSATNIDVDQVIASVSGAVSSVTGNVGGNVTGSVGSVTGLTNATIADAVWDEDATGHQTQGTFGQAIGDPVADTNTIYKAVVTDATGATVGVDVVALKAETVTILSDTDNIQTRLPAALVSGRMDASVGAMAADVLTAAATAADFGTEVATAVWVSGTRTLTAGTNINGSTFTSIPWNAAWDAEVESEVNDALVVQRLDELLNADSDIDGAAPPTVGSVFHELMTKTAGSFTYDQTTDSLEALRDRGDAAWITATGFATSAALSAVDAKIDIIDTNVDAILVDTAEIGAAGAGLTNINLPNQTMDIVGNITGNLSGSVGSVTGLTAANLDATISSRATPAQVNAEVVDALATDTYTEPTGAPGVTVSLKDKIGYIYMALRNKLTVTSSAKTFYDDGGAAEWSKALSDDSTTYTEDEGA